MPKQARAIETRETIVRAAGTVFAEKTYAIATMADVIREAGVTQGAVYFHFSSKHSLALEVIRSQHEKSIAIPAGVEGVEALILMSGELARQIQTDPVVQAGLRLSTESSELFPEIAAKPYEDWIGACQIHIEQAIIRGEVPAGSDARELARYVMSTFTGVQVVSRALSGWTDLFDRLEAMWPLVIAGIAVPERHAQLAGLAPAVRKRTVSH